MEKIAAIDIGSNAVRFTTAEITNENRIEMNEKIRIPLRLGSSAFSGESIFSENIIKYGQTVFLEIRKTLTNLNITRCRTVATSAVRDSKNSAEFIDAIFQHSGMKINTISGDLEAELIFRAIENKMEFDKATDYLMFDLGGGSLELSLVENGKLEGSHSVNLGTVRALEFMKTSKSSDELDLWMTKRLEKTKVFLDTHIVNSKNLNVIGTGGNFRRILKLSAQIFGNKSRSVSPLDIKKILEILNSHSYLDRIEKFDLRPDRADVILPAMELILKVIESLPVKKVFAPNVELIQGVLLDMRKGSSPQDQIFI